MPDFTINADSIDVEQIMRQIRARIREKRGVDYTEEQIRELAAAKLERFLDPTGVRSELLEQFRKRPTLPPGFLYQFEDTTLFDSDKPIVRFFRRLLRPILKLLFNPNVLSSTLHTQAAFNQYVYAHQPLQFELLHNLVLELTRAGIEVKNLKMRLESVQSRLEFNERRARALEAVVQYKPDTTRGRGEDRGERRHGRPEAPRSQPFQRAPQPPPPAKRADAAEESATATTEPQGGIDPITGGESLRTRRRRRRRGRRAAWDSTSAGLDSASAGSPAASGGSPDESDSAWDPASAGLSAGPTGSSAASAESSTASAALSDGDEGLRVPHAHGQAGREVGGEPDSTREGHSETADRVGLKPEPTSDTHSQTADEIRLKPDPTHVKQSQTRDEVPGEPDSTYGGRPDDGVDGPHDSADDESRGGDDEPR
jgi:hypothetical protein